MESVPRAYRGERLVAEVISLKCSCRTIRHALAPNLSDLATPRDHEVRCYQCERVLAIWLSSGSQ